MVYTKQTWADAPATSSPISAARLQHIEDGIDGLGRWTTFTPTWANISTTSATNAGRYSQIGKTVFVQAFLTTGVVTPVSGSITLTLPVTASTTNMFVGITVWGMANFRDASSGTTYPASVVYASSTTVTLRAFTASGTYLTNTVTSSTVPHTWDTGDIVNAQFSYEAA